MFANCGIPATGASATAASLSFDLTGLSTISTGSSFAKFERTFDLLFSNPITLSQENGPSLNLSQVTDVPSGDFCRSKKTISLWNGLICISIFKLLLFSIDNILPFNAGRIDNGLTSISEPGAKWKLSNEYCWTYLCELEIAGNNRKMPGNQKLYSDKLVIAFQTVSGLVVKLCLTIVLEEKG